MRYAPEFSDTSDVRALNTYVIRELQKIQAALYNPDPAWEDYRVLLTATKLGGSKDPGFAKLKDNGSGSQGVFAYHFDPTQEEELYFEVQLPHAFFEKHGVLKPHIHWCPTTTSTNTVRWGLEYTGANFGDVIGNTSIIYASEAGSGTAYKHQIAKFTDIDATTFGISRVMACRLFRDATNGADNYTSDAVALSFDFHLELSSPGSELEYKKYA